MTRAAGSWQPGVPGCPACGSERLLAVSDGEVTNFVCVRCAACWRIELGWMRRVTPAQCPGCSFKRMCQRAYEADALIADVSGIRDDGKGALGLFQGGEVAAAGDEGH